MKAMRILRWIGVSGLVAVLVAVGVLGAGAVLAVRSSFPDYEGSVSLPSLTARATVYRDEYGIPQIYADNAEDLFRAQGYVHAQDRFWEMDFRRHVTSGRLAELFGESQVDTDAFIRTMGWRWVAEEEYKLISEDTRKWLNAYADGVNAWLSSHSGLSASLEYGVLAVQNRGYRIEKWDPVDSLAWLKAMAWDLRTNLTDETTRAHLLANGLSREQVERLYPSYPDDRNGPIVSAGAVVNGTFDPAATPQTRTSAAATEAISSSVDVVRQRIDGIPALLGLNESGLGSNSWVISGSRTKSGKPLLANDPHLGPSMPSVWYQVGLHCTNVSAHCPFDVAGYSFSGLPGVVIGHNARVAWGFTNLGPDVADLYLERVTGSEYEVDGGRLSLETRQETIKVAGGDPVTITVRSTGHGPLISDRDEDYAELGEQTSVGGDGRPADNAAKADPGYAVALRWTALDPSRTADALFALNQASDWASFRAAAKLFAVPAQNMVYADVDGNIGYQAPGDIPIRGAGDGRWPAPGWDSRYDWTGLIPFEQLPTAFNPPSGYIVTANQAVIAPDQYPYLITGDWDYGYRAQRIVQLITGHSGQFDVAAIENMQFDSYNANAQVVTPFLLDVEPGVPARRAQALLRDWDYSQPADSAPAAYFNAIWRHLMGLTFDELPDDAEPDGGGRWFEVIRGLLTDPNSPSWNIVDTPMVETRDDILKRAMDEAVAELTDQLGADMNAWRWGELHTLTLRNESFGTSGIGLIEALFNRGPYHTAGGRSIVNATGWSASEGYEVDAVPSMRMIVDLADLDQSRWINLTGVSGHAYHRNYADQTELWRVGRTTPMRWNAETIAREARYRLVLNPR